MVEDDLAEGRLVQLDLPEAPGGRYPLFAVRRTDRHLGPATQWLAERLALARNLS